MGMGKELLADPDVARWHAGLGTSAARGYLRWLSVYCNVRGKSPKEVIDEFTADKKVGQDGIQDFIKSLEKQGYAPQTQHAALSAMKSWLEQFELKVTRKIKIENMSATPTVSEEEAPTSAELRDVLNHCDSMRTRCVTAMIAFTGMRYKTLAGLRLADFIEMEVGKEIKILKEPMRINVRSEISKNKKRYFVFLIHEGVQYLKSYLEKRAKEEDLTLQSSLFVADRTFRMRGRLVTKGDALTSGALSMLVRRAMRLAGLKQRPYVWKSYCDTAMVNGRLSDELQHFLMGRAGTIEARYSTRKRLSDAQVDEFRAKFAESVEPHLTTIPSAASPEQLRKQMILDSLQVLEMSGIDKLKLAPIREALEKTEPAELGTLMELVKKRAAEFGSRPFTAAELGKGLPPPHVGSKGLGEGIVLDDRHFVASKKIRYQATPALLKEFGQNGAGNAYQVEVVGKKDEKAIVQLLEQGFAWVQDLGTDRAVYRKKREV